MNPSNPLESVFYISIPENFVASDEAFKIDTKILSIWFLFQFIMQTAIIN